MTQLDLTVVDYQSPTRWYWRLTHADGRLPARAASGDEALQQVLTLAAQDT